MLSRLAYLALALLVGIGGIVLCRVTQSPLLESAASLLTGPAQIAAKLPVGAVGGLLEGAQSTAQLRQENQQLRAELDRLRSEMTQLPELQRENQLLRDQLGFRNAHSDLQWVSARVIGYDTDPLIKSIVINVGTRDGVADGMTVMTPSGLVGRVLRANPTTSKVLLTTDVSSSINGLLQESRARGVVNGSSTGTPLMRYIGQGETVRTGDKVVTSGLGGSFPPGLLIGSVIDVRQKDVDMFKEARIEPAVDFERLEIVLVVTNFLPTKLE